ncbi:WD repeat, SAM and U-box domain-containing protein 1-like [Ptychodera flava]|uniref:WD repeat, SAM and U-box domain-containing protein 1-like n=1 Tax=Ptychodera flava TaxID=63121 RepID=UPI00396A6824
MATLAHVINVHKGDVNWCAFSVTNYLATCSGDKTVRLWNVDDFSELPCSPLLGHTYYVHYVSFSPFGSHLASCSTDGNIIVWDPKTGEKKAVFQHKTKAIIRVCVFSPDSKYLVSGGADFCLYLWDLSKRESVRIFEGHENNVVSCSFTPDSSCIVSGSSDGDICVWDAQFGQGRRLYVSDCDVHELGVSCIVCSPTFGAATQHHESSDLADTDNPSYAVSNPGSKYFLMATCGADFMVKLWDLHVKPNCTIKLRCTLEGHTAQVMACAFSADGRLLTCHQVACCSLGGDKTVILWDPLKGDKLQTIVGHTRYVTSCAFSVDGQYLATGSNDKTCRLWKLNADTQSKPGETSIGDIQLNVKEVGGKKQPPVKQLHEWSVEDVCEWLKEMGLEQHVAQFQRNEIDGQELSTLTKEILTNDLGVLALGHRNKILRGIETIKEQCSLAAQLQGPAHGKDKYDDSGVPDELLCPITREIMRDPVIASDGYSYERSSIESWMRSGKNTSPMTNNILPNTTLTPNRMLKMLIERSQHKKL